MSPRRHRRAPGRNTPAGGSRASETVESWPDGDWAVRTVAGSPGKTYRCPGCDQEIPGAAGHVVAWPADGLGGPEQRRHWHTSCWRARDRRAANVQRTRNAPRYG
jgi:hypothetical protein